MTPHDSLVQLKKPPGSGSRCIAILPHDLSDIQNISDVWISTLDGQPYVRLQIQDSGFFCKANFNHLSHGTQQKIISSLQTFAKQQQHQHHQQVCNVISHLKNLQKSVPCGEQLQLQQLQRIQQLQQQELQQLQDTVESLTKQLEASRDECNYWKMAFAKKFTSSGEFLSIHCSME